MRPGTFEETAALSGHFEHKPIDAMSDAWH